MAVDGFPSKEMKLNKTKDFDLRQPNLVVYNSASGEPSGFRLCSELEKPADGVARMLIVRPTRS
jgi:hypothetical protein